MNFRGTKYKSKILVFGIVFIVLLNTLILIQIIPLNSNIHKYENQNTKGSGITQKPQVAADQYFTNIPWLNNTNFSSPSINPWKNSTSGDYRDVLASNSTGQADYIIIGEKGRKEISNVFQNPSKWKVFNKSAFDLRPDNYNVDLNGAWCDHNYNEDANQFPKVYWRYNVSMGLDMSDYEIVSAKIDATVNASVNANFDVTGDINARPGDAIESRDLFDSIYFSIEVSDMNISPLNTYIIGDNRTTNLGDDVAPTFLSITKTSLIFRSEENLAFYLSKVLNSDPGHDNFTILLGMYIICADNSDNGDIDEVYEARIESLNLTFTYEKKIDKSTTLSWSQTGGMINYTNVQVLDAKFNFDFKIGSDWNDTTSSQFSEFRIYINNNIQKKYPNLKLISYNYSKYNGAFINARTDGYDLTNLIPLNESITLSLQLFIGDNFNLDQNVNVSIDNVYFVISYVVFLPSSPSNIIISGDDDKKGSVTEEPWIFLLIAIAAIAGSILLGSYLVEYYLVLKYPKPVRKVRKFRRKLKKNEPPKVQIIGREVAFNEKYKEKTITIPSEIKTSRQKKPKIIKKEITNNRK